MGSHAAQRELVKEFSDRYRIVDRIFVWRESAYVKEFGGDADHTWVTSHENQELSRREYGDYWYCWGEAYQKPDDGLVLSETANLDVARSISTPHDREDTAGIPKPYFLFGTCHQIVNRILYATKTRTRDPLTLSKDVARYNVSRSLFGTYGCKGQECLQDWERKTKELDEMLL